MKTQSCGPTCFQANIVFYTFLLFSSSLAKLSESIPQASSCNTLSAYFCQHPYLKSVLGHHSSTQELDSICNQDNEIAFSISGLRFWESKGGSLLSLSSQPMVDGWYNTYPAIEPFFSCRQCNFKSPYKVDAQFSIEESHSIWQILALWVNNSINSELAPPKTDIWLRFGNRYDFDQSKQTFHPNTIIPPPVRSFSTFLWAPFFHKDYKTDIYIYDGECRSLDYINKYPLFPSIGNFSEGLCPNNLVTRYRNKFFWDYDYLSLNFTKREKLSNISPLQNFRIPHTFFQVESIIPLVGYLGNEKLKVTLPYNCIIALPINHTDNSFNIQIGYLDNNIPQKSSFDYMFLDNTILDIFESRSSLDVVFLTVTENNK